MDMSHEAAAVCCTEERSCVGATKAEQTARHEQSTADFRFLFGHRQPIPWQTQQLNSQSSGHAEQKP